MRASAVLVVFVALTLAGSPTPAPAEEWGGIEPGVTTLDAVRSRYGAPTRETHAKVEGYDTTQWVYESAQAPGGIQRMTIDYGLLTPQGYKPNVVRVIRLEPKTMVFGRNTVVQGFGVPDGISTQDGQEIYFYKSGLLVTFNKEGTEAVILNFTPPQPDQPSATPKQ
ncbi:MAG TPA: hypothetical protein VFT36_02465 [Methylomirabilota bacterium]|nr:hypothetical protein [Methylomirabilota bacterium]